MPRGVSVPTRKVALINQLTHTKGPFAGQPFNLRPWQERDIIRPLFKLNPATGLRAVPHLPADDAAQERQDRAVRGAGH